MEQQIRFCTTSDGVRIAYATLGQGSPLVMVSGWISHLKFVWNYPETRAFWEGLAGGRLLVRYDKRGMGLSDRDAQDFSLDGRLRDLDAVVDALGLERFAIAGYSEGGPTAITYAVRHPERVSRVVLYGSYHYWPFSREDTEPILALVRAQWGMGSAALAAAFVPSGDPEMVARFTKVERVAASAQSAAKYIEVNMDIDVTALLKDVRAPTLVVHRRGDTISPFKVAREMAALIPDAQLEPLEGDDHPPMLGDAKAVLDAINAFLRETEAGTGAEGLSADIVHTILFTDVEGSTALTDRLGDAKARELLREHEPIAREALKSHGGSEVKALGDGFMASFSSATRALKCSIALQRAFAQHNEGAEEPIIVRVGLNAGEPIAEDEDLFGTAVIEAARIAATAQGGEILVANVVRELAKGRTSCSRTVARRRCGVSRTPFACSRFAGKTRVPSRKEAS